MTKHQESAPPIEEQVPAELVNTEGLLPIDVLGALYEYTRYLDGLAEPDQRRNLQPIKLDELYAAMRLAHEGDDPRQMVHNIGPVAIEVSLFDLAKLHVFDASPYNAANGPLAAQDAVREARDIRGIPQPKSAAAIQADLQERLEQSAADEEAKLTVSDEPLELFLLPGKSKMIEEMRERARNVIGSWSSTSDPKFETIIRPYLAEEFRDGEGWERALLAINGYRRALAEREARKRDAWLNDTSVMRQLARGVAGKLARLLPGAPADTTPPPDDPDAWTR